MYKYTIIIIIDIKYFHSTKGTKNDLTFNFKFNFAKKSFIN